MKRLANEHRQSRPAFLTLAVLIMASASGCSESAPMTAPSPPGTPSPVVVPPPQSSPSATRYHLSGRVTTDTGSPIAGALVEVDHGKVAGSTTTSNCPSFATGCWVATHTNAGGEYAFEVEAGPMRDQRLGYVFSYVNGYALNVQWMPPASPAVLDLPLRRIRSIRAGESTSVSVEPTSSLCSDLEDLFALTYRCEFIQVEASQAGTLGIDVRAAAGSLAVPRVFWMTSGNYAGIGVLLGPSTMSIPVSGGTYTILAGVPDGSPTERLDVITSLQ